MGQLAVPQAGGREAAGKRIDRPNWSEPGTPQAALNPLIGKPAPQFSLEDLSGKKVSLADYKGKALLINFWATWCGPCKVETPWIVDLRNQYARKGSRYWACRPTTSAATTARLFGTEKKEIADFVQRMHMPYPVLIEGDKLKSRTAGWTRCRRLSLSIATAR